MNTGYIDKLRVKKFNFKNIKSVKKEKEALNHASFPSYLLMKKLCNMLTKETQNLIFQPYFSYKTTLVAE